MDAFITFDLDHIHCNSKYYTTHISFDYQETIYELYDFLHSIDAKFTAFVRIDQQIKDLFGDYFYVLNMLPESKNAEIGWHPHFSSQDSTEIIQEIYNIYHVMPKMTSVRLGGAIMDNDIMSTLSNLNFKVDSSALPGCVRDDQHRKYDWSLTGNSMYHPFMHDYRCGGDPHQRILEVPMTTIPIKAPYDCESKRRYLNPTIKKEIFQPAFLDYYQYLSFAVVVFHPDQLITGYEDDLYRYGMDNFIDNMNLINSIGVTYKVISDI